MILHDISWINVGRTVSYHPPVIEVIWLPFPVMGGYHLSSHLAARGGPRLNWGALLQAIRSPRFMRMFCII